MKQTKLIIITLAFFAFSSCKKEEKSNSPIPESNKTIQLTPEEYQSIAFDDLKRLSDETAASMVKSFIASKKIYNVASEYKITLEEKSTVSLNKFAPNTKSPLKEDNIPVYKFSITQNKSLKDIAIVSADERHPTVMAYYSEGKDSTAIDIGSKLLIEASMELLKDNIKKVEQNKLALRAITLEKIAKKLSIKKENLNFKDIKEKIAVTRLPQTKAPIVTDPSVLGAPVASYGPYLSTAWSIGMPYNRTMAQSCPNNWLWDNRYAISSAAVATAQILAAYQPSMTIGNIYMNWSYLTENKEIHEESDYFGSYVQDPIERRNMVAALMKGIGESCFISYTCTGSSVNFNNIRGFLSHYGIQTSNQINLNIPAIKNSIENLKPVIMYGQTSSNQGHWWVVDGTYVTTGNSSYLPGFNFYIHANMGQGKSYNGYYLVGTDQSVTFDTSFAHFTKNFQVYPIATAIFI